MDNSKPHDSILNSELIGHFSKEIESSTQAMTSFRLKGNFTIFYAPFIALGTFLLIVKDGWKNNPIGFIDILLMILTAFFWLCMGYFAFEIEKHSWDQCNHWRKCIAKLQYEKPHALLESDFTFEHNLRKGYVFNYICQFLIFITIITLVLRLGGFFDRDKKPIDSQRVGVRLETPKTSARIGLCKVWLDNQKGR